MEQGWLGKAVAEFVGVLGLVFFGAGSVVIAATRFADAGYAGLIGIALAHALALAVVVSATMNISGAHINPAVTVAAFLTRRISAQLAGVYVVAQLLGATLGAALIRALLVPAGSDPGTMGTTTVAADLGMLKAVAIELVLTFFLVFAVWGTAVSKHHPPGIAGFGIGLVLIFDILVGGPLTGASMNPARTFGPALLSGTWSDHLVYWIGPILGAALAAAVYEGFVEKGATSESKAPPTE